MKATRGTITLSAGFILLFSALYFFDETGMLSAFIPAVLIHELGHALMLRLYGVNVSGLHLTLSGVRMDYEGRMSTPGELISAAAGPIFGILYAFFASEAGKWLDSDFLKCSAGISIMLSLFNLLPSRPLDGGRILNTLLSIMLDIHTTEIVIFVISLAISAASIIGGLWLYLHNFGAALIIIGFWLLWYTLTDSK